MTTAVAEAGLDLTWQQALDLAWARLEQLDLPDLYSQRLRYELKEIDNQGSNAYWVNLINGQKRFSANPSRLVLPWLLGMVEEDPIANLNEERDGPLMLTSNYSDVMAVIDRYGKPPVDMIQDSDKPDIDLDCLPHARGPIKQYAQQKYGSQGDLTPEAAEYGYVCSVGTWQTYLLRSAIIDVYKALGHGDKDAVLAMTTMLPDEVDELKDGGRAVCKNTVSWSTKDDKSCGTVHDQVLCPKCGSDSTETPTIARLMRDYPTLREFNEGNPGVVMMAVGLVGKIRNMGMHAGALIIADRPLYGNLPLAARTVKDKNTKDRSVSWISTWTEGRNTQLSKFGYNKWDILGLKNLQYITTCCKLIEQNRRISFGARLEGWAENDPENNQAGWYELLDELDPITGRPRRVIISLNDPDALRLANEQRTDAVFQFDTSLAKRILSNGVSNFEDLMLFNAMGHPGPMDSIPEAVANRADEFGEWRERLAAIHPELLNILVNTYGVICYQEQLAAVWQLMASFTSPEAQDARKAVAKKWKEKLKPVEAKWMEGASKTMGEEAAREWWGKMVTFGRYAFNKCLALDTPVMGIDGEIRSIQDARGMVLWSEHGPDLVKTVHFNGHEAVYEVVFDNGVTELVTAGHRYLTDDGYVMVRELNLDHAVKYIDGGDRGTVSQADGGGRVTGAGALWGGSDLQSDSSGRRGAVHVGSHDQQDSTQVWGTATIPDQDAHQPMPHLSGRLEPGGVLLDWIADGRWVCEWPSRDCSTSIASAGRGHCAWVCGLLRRAVGSTGVEEAQRSALTDAEVRGLQQAIGYEIERIWSRTQEDTTRVGTNVTAHGEFRTGFPRWRWDYLYQQEGLPDGWIRFRLGLHVATPGADSGTGAVVASESSFTGSADCRLCPADLDGLGAVPWYSGLGLQRIWPGDGSEACSRRLHLRSVRYMGVRPVFSPEMLSRQHNYSIGPGHPIAANSHAVAYCLWAYVCLWLKAHFPVEWWAAVMSDCHQDKLVRYMGVAKTEGVKFDPLNINKLTVNFDVTGDSVNPGLIGLKRVGQSAAEKFAGEGVYEDIDSFVAGKGKAKVVMERLIKLGSFQHLPGHENRRALWHWYLYRYCSGKDVTTLRTLVRQELRKRNDWSDDAILAERRRHIDAYRIQYPKKTKIPKKVTEWEPPLTDTRANVMALFPDDFTTTETLLFEREYLGYYMSNPLERYEHYNSFNVTQARQDRGGVVHAVIMRVERGKTKKQEDMCRVGIHDGHADELLLLWSDDMNDYASILADAETALSREKKQGEDGQPKFELGVGLRVRCNKGKHGFTLARPSRYRPGQGGPAMWRLKLTETTH